MTDEPHCDGFVSPGWGRSDYEPWVELGVTEAEYWKRAYIGAMAEKQARRTVIEAAKAQEKAYAKYIIKGQSLNNGLLKYRIACSHTNRAVVLLQEVEGE